jgi:hypothetical protein
VCARIGRSVPDTNTYNGVRSQTTLTVRAAGDALGAGDGAGAAAMSASAASGANNRFTALET